MSTEMRVTESDRKRRVRKAARAVTPAVAGEKADVTAAARKSLQKIVADAGESTAEVVALFAGPNSAAQAMAAEALANQLGRRLQRVDLGEVVSKYIGETEKNLQRIFAVAAAKSAILFFDEADALFGKRSEVKDSHDRYANTEINYLLQRLKSFQGLAIIATNDVRRIDPALKKRFGYVVRFPQRPAK